MAFSHSVGALALPRKAAARTRSGRVGAKVSAIHPPSEWPAIRTGPSAQMVEQGQRVRGHLVHGVGGGGADEGGMPRLSKVITR